jgi:hypothetical protein
MRKILVLAAFALILGGAIGRPALADVAGSGCRPDPQAASISKDAMRAKIENLGYDVRRLNTDGGCFKAHLVDRQSRGAVKAVFSVTTGELVRARLSS